MWGSIRFLLLSIFCFSTAAQAELVDLTGVWESTYKARPIKLHVRTEGKKIWAHFWQSYGTTYLEGERTETEASLKVFIPYKGFNDTPEDMRLAALRGYGSATRFGFIETTAVMKFKESSGEIEILGTVQSPILHYRKLPDGGREFVKLTFDEDPRALNATRPKKIDLAVLSFKVEVEAKKSPEDPEIEFPYYVLTAKVKNVGNEDLKGKYKIYLQSSLESYRDASANSWTDIEDSEYELEDLKKDEAKEVVWTTDKLPEGAKEIFFPPVVNGLRAKISASEDLKEILTENNQKDLWSMLCPKSDEIEDALMPFYTVWTEADPDLATDEGKQEALVRYLKMFQKMESHAGAKHALLCYIQMEAERRSYNYKKRLGSKSKFFNYLVNGYFKKYLEAPSKEQYKKTQEAVGEQESLTWANGMKLYVPKRIRTLFGMHADEYTYLYPATSWFATTTKVEAPGSIYSSVWKIEGKNSKHVPYIDSNVLVGGLNRGTGADADVKGGRNVSNVMHWATGFTYSHLSPSAMRLFFIGYEYWHLEGWDVFGEDAVNDLIAEEQGRLIGMEMERENIKNIVHFRDVFDESFWHARAWVGKMINQRLPDFDKMILTTKKHMPKAEIWWNPARARGVYPLGKGNAESFDAIFKSGKSPFWVAKNDVRVDRIIQVYTLAYEADRWTEDFPGRPLDLHPLTRAILRGDYDATFKASDKNWGAAWEIE